jgi:hypothetical protein
MVAHHCAGVLANAAQITLVWPRNPYYPLGLLRFQTWLQYQNLDKSDKLPPWRPLLGLYSLLSVHINRRFDGFTDGHNPFSRARPSSPKLLRLWAFPSDYSSTLFLSSCGRPLLLQMKTKVAEPSERQKLLAQGEGVSSHLHVLLLQITLPSHGFLGSLTPKQRSRSK